MKSFTLSIVTSLLVLTLLTSEGNFVKPSFAQDNMTGASNNTGAKMGNQTNQQEANCWGQTTSDVVNAEDHGDRLGGNEFGQHAVNPTGDDDRDTPREGVGNQDKDHPSDHADEVGDNFVSDEECIDED